MTENRDLDFLAYKQERLEEISLIIKESGKKIEAIEENTRFDDIIAIIEKLKKEYPWLE